MWASDLCGLRKRLGYRQSGRFGDTIRLGRCELGGRVGPNTLVGLLHCWDVPAIPWSVGGDVSCTQVQDSTVRDTMRWVWFGPGCQRLGRFGDTKRYHCACALGNWRRGASSLPSEDGMQILAAGQCPCLPSCQDSLMLRGSKGMHDRFYD